MEGHSVADKVERGHLLGLTLAEFGIRSVLWAFVSLWESHSHVVDMVERGHSFIGYWVHLWRNA